MQEVKRLRLFKLGTSWQFPLSLRFGLKCHDWESIVKARQYVPHRGVDLFDRDHGAFHGHRVMPEIVAKRGSYDGQIQSLPKRLTAISHSPDVDRYSVGGQGY
jgi:hypothetical protein